MVNSGKMIKMETEAKWPIRLKMTKCPIFQNSKNGQNSQTGQNGKKLKSPEQSD